jgi:transposase
MLFTWRREVGAVTSSAPDGAVTFVPAALVAEPGLTISAAPPVPAGRKEIALGGGDRVIVGADIDAAALARVVKVLSRRRSGGSAAKWIGATFSLAGSGGDPIHFWHAATPWHDARRHCCAEGGAGRRTCGLAAEVEAARAIGTVSSAEALIAHLRLAIAKVAESAGEKNFSQLGIWARHGRFPLYDVIPLGSPIASHTQSMDRALRPLSAEFLSVPGWA